MVHDLLFLPLSWRKDITLPKVVFEEFNNQNYGGYYEHNSSTLTVVNYDDSHTVSTLVHEFIHYKQELEGKLVPNKYHFGKDINSDYELAMKKYFIYNKIELEALYYQYKLCRKDDTTNYWVKHCLGLKLFDSIT